MEERQRLLLTRAAGRVRVWAQFMEHTIDHLSTDRRATKRYAWVPCAMRTRVDRLTVNIPQAEQGAMI
jgi:hypothetical protein